MTKENHETAPYKEGTTRVQLFRERMKDDYRRVEAYITADEKVQLDQIKAELNISNDRAVAGLIRMGLEQYAQSQVAAATPPDTFGGQLCTLTAGASLQATNTLAGLSGIAGPALAQQTPMRFSASSVSNPVSPVTTQPLDNPIARFFRSRKENNND